jgi:hypothetical protein
MIAALAALVEVGCYIVGCYVVGCCVAEVIGVDIIASSDSSSLESLVFAFSILGRFLGRLSSLLRRG